MTTMRARVLAAIAALLGLIFCAGCTPLAGGNDDGRPTIGLAVANQQADFFNMIRQAVETSAEDQGFRLIVADAKGDADTQVSQIQNFITQEVDAIIYIPAGATAATVPVRDAHAAGIPIVAVDRNPQGAPADSFIATDSIAAAKDLGDYVIDITRGQGKVGVVQGQIGTTPEQARDEGFTEALDSAPGMEQVAKQASQQWSQSEGFDITTDMLQAHPQINVMFGRADALALGAAAAARAAGRTDMTVVGFDGDIAGLEAVRDGRLAATVTQPTYGMGALAVQSAKALIAGQPVPAEQLQQGLLTTRDNAAEFLQQHP
ncbi:substrate-binding domain-containing protein [Rhodococcus sp. NCIMB 12038]|jgi:ribose transport system substrate-binding protein|uniref:substrate-binding domain-containing protein n=1 Tax=Rhodococcus sp. NCIMB 12038 TaxID=933800 RepID=UPI000B3CCAB4|nr:substrate-binding domain-containing protein [Rhodococcus sp. NCIMB 12038]OUS88548.1 sugar ABC transporter substrate-binding protein [Rhodococcus sp. NCIMB 12038]